MNPADRHLQNARKAFLLAGVAPDAAQIRHYVDMGVDFLNLAKTAESDEFNSPSLWTLQ
jgi:hypothetical protein